MAEAGDPLGVDAYVGLGSNLGDRAATLESAFTALAELPRTRLLQRSSYYASPAHEAPGGEYLNAVAHLRTTSSPLQLLHRLQQIEAAHGRSRSFRNAPRTLDLDLLLYAETVSSLSELQLPHPRLHERAFVLRPLAELAPDLQVPGHGAVRDLLTAVATQDATRLSP